jgi:hypothetical protein
MSKESTSDRTIQCGVPAADLAALIGHLSPRATEEFYAMPSVAMFRIAKEEAKDQVWAYWSDAEDEDDEEDWADVGELFSYASWDNDDWVGSSKSPRNEGPKVVCPSCGGTNWIEWAPADYVQFEVHLRLSEDYDPILESEATDGYRLTSETDVGPAEFFACSRCNARHEYEELLEIGERQRDAAR